MLWTWIQIGSVFKTFLEKIVEDFEVDDNFLSRYLPITNQILDLYRINIKSGIQIRFQMVLDLSNGFKSIGNNPLKVPIFRKNSF